MLVKSPVRQNCSLVSRPSKEIIPSLANNGKPFFREIYQQFLACEGDEIVGLAINRYIGKLGWINHQGIRRPWRGKGIGKALLLHSFREFYQRGTHKVGLNVDAQSLTGAHLLFARAGMHSILSYHLYEKELRAGRVVSPQGWSVD